jgi:hypothetical protein
MARPAASSLRDSASRNPAHRRQIILFEPADYKLYRHLPAERPPQGVGRGLRLLPDAQPCAPRAHALDADGLKVSPKFRDSD